MTESSKTMKTTTTTTTTTTKKIGNYDPVDLVLSSTCSCSDETCLHWHCSMDPWAMETYSHSYHDPDCETSSSSSSRRLHEHS
jgi:hypothetical protein